MAELSNWWLLVRTKRTGRGHAVDLTGSYFGRLEVIGRAGSDKHGASLWLCKCDCGNKKVCRRGDLKRGKVKSCGCLQREYQASHKPYFHRSFPVETENAEDRYIQGGTDHEFEDDDEEDEADR